MIETESLKDGTKWDDIVLHLEWQQSFEILLEQHKENHQVREVLKLASQSMRYCFNEEMVNGWMTNDQGDLNAESFQKFVSQNFQKLQRQKIARIDELIDSMINQLRDDKGKFHLHEGFSKECGLKGSKLSGG